MIALLATLFYKQSPFLIYFDLNCTSVPVTEIHPFVNRHDSRIVSFLGRANNLLGIYEAMTGQTREQVALEIESLAGWGSFKPLLTEALIAHLEPLQQRYYEIIGEPEYLTNVLRQGQEAADEVAGRTLANAKRAMGFTLSGDTKLPKL